MFPSWWFPKVNQHWLNIARSFSRLITLRACTGRRKGRGERRKILLCYNNTCNKYYWKHPVHLARRDSPRLTSVIQKSAVLWALPRVKGVKSAFPHIWSQTSCVREGGFLHFCRSWFLLPWPAQEPRCLRQDVQLMLVEMNHTSDIVLQISGPHQITQILSYLTPLSPLRAREKGWKQAALTCCRDRLRLELLSSLALELSSWCSVL